MVDTSLETAGAGEEHAPEPEALPAEPSSDTGAGEEGADPQAEGQDDAGAAEQAQELLSDEEFEALKDNPAALRKALNRSYTQKMQSLSNARQLAEHLENNPDATLARLAELRGYELSKRGGAAAAPSQRSAVAEKLRETLGDEVAGVIMPAIEALAKEMVQSELGPIKQGQQRLTEDAAYTASMATLKAFEAKYPDWKKFEGKMVELGKTMLPGPNVDDFKYLENLLTIARSNNDKGKTIKGAVERMQKSAGAGDPRPGGTPGARVAPESAGQKRSFKEAFEMAKRGIRAED